MKMPKGKKTKTQDISKLKHIDAYTHENKKRSDIPTVGMAQYDTAEEKVKQYQYDPHIDPSLQWAGKAEKTSFEIPSVSLHIHEKINPLSIISAVRTEEADPAVKQLSLFQTEGDVRRMRRQSVEFYKHDVDWTNRLIAGDSLLVINSLIEKEGMGGQVQMVYIDPPYGIKYGSNFQPFVDKRDVKDGKDEDLTQEPEMIKAFRDTWELGIHSYLTYLRDRLLLARDLLSESGSVFVQISDENVHLVRNLCDEVFGMNNFIALIPFRKKGMTLGAKTLESMNDYIVWYAKDIGQIKYRQLYEDYNVEGASRWTMVELSDGSRRKLSSKEYQNHKLLPVGSKVFRLVSQRAPSFSINNVFSFEYEGIEYKAPGCWVTNLEGMNKLAVEKRFYPEGVNLSYIQYITDFPYKKLTNLWTDTSGANDKIYVVQTSEKPIQRCLLMTTDPSDLVLDITCGSGTTAYVAEQWGRRWITCDTSRVAITLAKQRLMTAVYEYYKLAYPEQGVGSGFIYKTVPHITLKSIANNEPPAQETLYDQPEIDKNKVRVTGPFTIEAVPAPVVKPLDDTADYEDASAKHTDWREELFATGILGRNGQKIEFSRIETIAGTKYLQAEAETKEDTPRKAVICFANETKPLDKRMVDMALDEAENLRPTPKLIIFAAFQFDPEAARAIDDTIWDGVTVLKAQMNTDLLTEDLKKKRSSNQSFWLVGQPDVEINKIEKGKDKGKHKVKLNGYDYYDVKKGIVDSGDVGRIAMWMLDTDYDGMCIKPTQVFFPMSGEKDGWSKLAKTLKAEIDQELIEQYAGNESLPFEIKPDTRIAIKIVDDRGIESLKIIKAGYDL
jgi:adenine-specific DNA-methyltransferase